MVFTFINFVAPQAFVPALQSLRIALVSAGITLVAYLLDRLSWGRPLTVTVPAVRWLFWFVALAGVGIPFSLWPGGSFDAFFSEFLKSVLIFLLIANTVDTLRRVKLLIGSMAVWCVLMSLTAVRDFGEGNVAHMGRIYGYDSPLAENPNTLSLILSLVLGLLIGLYYAAPRGLQKWVLLVGIGLLTAGVIVSFSRAGFLGLMVIAAMVLVRQVRERRPAVVVAALLMLLLALLVLPHGYGQRLYSILDTSEDVTGSAQARWTMMTHAWNTIIHHPLLGVGLRMHGLDLLDQLGDWGATLVHNVYLQIGADLGIPALVVYLLVIWELLKGLRQSMRRLKGIPGGRELVAVGTGIQMALVAFLVEAFFHPVAYHLYFFYVGGLAVAFSEVSRNIEVRTRGERERAPSRAVDRSLCAQ